MAVDEDLTFEWISTRIRYQSIKFPPFLEYDHRCRSISLLESRNKSVVGTNVKHQSNDVLRPNAVRARIELSTRPSRIDILLRPSVVGESR